MQPTRIEPFLSVDAYLDGELASDVRHEYVDGEVYAMVRASDRHGLIAGNLHSALNLRLPDCCQVFMADMKVRIQTTERDIFYYPDLLVSCDPGDRERYYRERPCLVVEVLSPPTERLDRFEKFLFYRQLDSLEEYVLVAQEYRQLEVFCRDEQWKATKYTEGTVPLRSVDLSVTHWERRLSSRPRVPGARRPRHAICGAARMVRPADLPSGREPGHDGDDGEAERIESYPRRGEPA
jgi:Uma2 family endonuclease